MFDANYNKITTAEVQKKANNIYKKQQNCGYFKNKCRRIKLWKESSTN
jgi:hypothetical protein